MIQSAPLNPARPARPSFWARLLRRNLLACLGLGIVTLFVLVALLAPLLAPPQGNCRRALGMNDTQVIPGPVAYLREVIATPAACLQMPREGFSAEPSPPAAGAPLGRVAGYDIRYGLVWGTRTALFLGVCVLGVTILLACLVGVAAGMLGGLGDNLLMRLTDVILAFPGLILVMVLVAALGPGLLNIIVALSLVAWTGLARIIRSEVLRVRELEFISAARGLGASGWRVALRHVLPNAIGPLLTISVLDMGALPIVAGTLSFLGLGTPLGYADWGQLIAMAQKWIQGPPGQPLAYWYVTLFPGLCIFAYSLGWTLLGDAVSETLDPRNR